MEIQQDVAHPFPVDEGLGLIEDLLVKEPEGTPVPGRDTHAGERR